MKLQAIVAAENGIAKVPAHGRTRPSSTGYDRMSYSCLRNFIHQLELAISHPMRLGTRKHRSRFTWHEKGRDRDGDSSFRDYKSSEACNGNKT